MRIQIVFDRIDTVLYMILHVDHLDRNKTVVDEAIFKIR